MQEVLAELSEQFWIVRGLQAAKRILHYYQREKARAHMEVRAPLPQEVVLPFHPFEAVGTDCVDLLHFLDDNSYVLIFTCYDDVRSTFGAHKINSS